MSGLGKKCWSEKKQVWLTFPNISKKFEIMGESIQNEVANQTPPTFPLLQILPWLLGNNNAHLLQKEILWAGLSFFFFPPLAKWKSSICEFPKSIKYALDNCNLSLTTICHQLCGSIAVMRDESQDLCEHVTRVAPSLHLVRQKVAS